MKKALYILAILILAVPAYAGTLSIPNTFVSGTSAKASEVNENFDAIDVAVDDNATRIAALEASLTAALGRIGSLESSLATTQTTMASSLATTQAALEIAEDHINALTARVLVVEANPSSLLAPYVTVEQGIVSGFTGPHIIFSGVNIHIRSAEDATCYGPKNGLGNIILGSSIKGRNTFSHELYIGAGYLENFNLQWLDHEYLGY